MGIMPHWVLIAEYLPLFALLAIIYFFKRYAGQNRAGNIFQTNRTEKIMETKKTVQTQLDQVPRN